MIVRPAYFIALRLRGSAGYGCAAHTVRPAHSFPHVFGEAGATQRLRERPTTRVSSVFKGKVSPLRCSGQTQNTPFIRLFTHFFITFTYPSPDVDTS